MSNNLIDFGKIADGKKLFDMLVNSAYMKDRGYEIFYAQKYYDENQTQTKNDGVTITKSTSGEINGYGLCYRHDDLLYLHIRIKAGTTTEFSYNITMGDKATIEVDLTELVKEIRSIFLICV